MKYSLIPIYELSDTQIVISVEYTYFLKSIYSLFNILKNPGMSHLFLSDCYFATIFHKYFSSLAGLIT